MEQNNTPELVSAIEALETLADGAKVEKSVNVKPKALTADFIAKADESTTELVNHLLAAALFSDIIWFMTPSQIVKLKERLAGVPEDGQM